MIIGFSNGDFHKLYNNPLDKFSEAFIKHLQAGGANAIELHCSGIMEALLHMSLDLSSFSFVSIHAPAFPYANNSESIHVLSQMEQLSKKYNVRNIVVHPDTVLDWSVFQKYKSLPFSIENMDEQKKFGRTITDIKSVLDYYDFKLTLDLQHCFVNDPSMQLAVDFQTTFKDRIVAYHISGYSAKQNHVPLYKTGQMEIIRALNNKEIPIIIESSFEKIGEQEKELAFIKEHLSH